MNAVQLSHSTHTHTEREKSFGALRYSILLASLMIAAALVCSPWPSLAQTTISPKSMKVLGNVDPRYVSYNIEAVEVTGGRFWAPYKSMQQRQEATVPGPTAGAQIRDDVYQYRPPIDLANPKLRKLAAALSPSYVRVSGTWRNSSYFQDNDEPALKVVPDGFQNILTQAEWKGVIKFGQAVDAQIVTSFASSAGTRDANGVWTTAQAKALLDYTKAVGGHIAVTEFINEPTLMNLGGVPKGYGAAEYGKESQRFGEFLRKESPGTLYLGPSSAGEGVSQTPPISAMHLISTDELMKATGPIFDGFSYHVYYTRAHRCMGDRGTNTNELLKPDWFERGLEAESFYAKLRDQYLPGKDIWLTETGEASCGGDTWASQFIDSFRLLDQFGSLAQKSVKSIMYNTLASSDYGWVDEDTLVPRPNYWSALLWKRTMGTRALDPGIGPVPGMRIYAQCMKNAPGGVAILVLNVDKSDAHSLSLPVGGQRYTLSSPDLMSKTVLLNGKELSVAADGSVPEYKGEGFKKGLVSFAPTTISILTLPGAGNASCK